MSEPLGDPVAAAQDRFDDAIKDGEKALETYKKEAKLAKSIAYTLKGIALFGGLVVATVPVTAVILGFIIAAAVLLDQLFSNFGRLIVYTEAAHAIERTLDRIKANHTHEIIPIIDLNLKPETQSVARRMLIALLRDSTKVIRDELARVKKAITDKDIQFLSTLNLDSKPNTALPKVDALMPSVESPQVEQ